MTTSSHTETTETITTHRTLEPTTTTTTTATTATDDTSPNSSLVDVITTDRGLDHTTAADDTSPNSSLVDVINEPSLEYEPCVGCREGMGNQQAHMGVNGCLFIPWETGN